MLRPAIGTSCSLGWSRCRRRWQGLLHFLLLWGSISQGTLRWMLLHLSHGLVIRWKLMSGRRLLLHVLHRLLLLLVLKMLRSHLLIHLHLLLLWKSLSKRRLLIIGLSHHVIWRTTTIRRIWRLILLELLLAMLHLLIGRHSRRTRRHLHLRIHIIVRMIHLHMLMRWPIVERRLVRMLLMHVRWAILHHIVIHLTIMPWWWWRRLLLVIVMHHLISTWSWSHVMHGRSTTTTMITSMGHSSSWRRRGWRPSSTASVHHVGSSPIVSSHHIMRWHSRPSSAALMVHSRRKVIRM